MNWIYRKIEQNIFNHFNIYNLENHRFVLLEVDVSILINGNFSDTNMSQKIVNYS